ncbi:hypothetical protein QE152_g34894 [Popillia japonica]|uniref:Endonuclease/exonuclease/phosphatase domain-containing protein n=1 Tax=Popillia japonica TaxID=7064 RepID=A0AAW1ISB3_POPJA
MFEEATAYFNNHVIILGDFNITYFNDHSNRDRKCQIIDAFLNFTDFHQINTVANNRGRLLDLVITNFAQLSLEREELPLVQEDLDHPAIKLCLKHIDAQLSLEREELPLVQEDLDHPAIKLCLKHIENHYH